MGGGRCAAAGSSEISRRGPLKTAIFLNSFHFFGHLWLDMFGMSLFLLLYTCHAADVCVSCAPAVASAVQDACDFWPKMRFSPLEVTKFGLSAYSAHRAEGVGSMPPRLSTTKTTFLTGTVLRTRELRELPARLPRPMRSGYS